MDPPSLLSKTAPDFWPFQHQLQQQQQQQQQQQRRSGGFCGREAGFHEVGGGGRDGLAEESSVTELTSGGSGSRRRQRDFTVDGDCSKELSTSGDKELTDSEGKHIKMTRSRDGNEDLKPEASLGTCSKLTDQNNQPSEAPKEDYIHVRARRGQATDSHSLAERARREKLSERMKILQDLVPGCSKIIGKALVLDEIINYVQSLQRQVEFLSMKLEAVNSRVNSTIEGFPAKDIGFQPSNMTFNPQPPREYVQESASEWLHMQVGGGFDRAT